MITRRDLEITVQELENTPPTYQSCAKLADLYIILDHLPGYSETQKVARQETHKVAHRETESEFMKRIEGKDMDAVLGVIDELIEATEILNPRLYENVMMRIDEL